MIGERRVGSGVVSPGLRIETWEASVVLMSRTDQFTVTVKVVEAAVVAASLPVPITVRV